PTLQQACQRGIAPSCGQFQRSLGGANCLFKPPLLGIRGCEGVYSARAAAPGDLDRTLSQTRGVGAIANRTLWARRQHPCRTVQNCRMIRRELHRLASMHGSFAEPPLLLLNIGKVSMGLCIPWIDAQGPLVVVNGLRRSATTIQREGEIVE